LGPLALRLHDGHDVADTRVSFSERSSNRRGWSGDRRKNSRSGRRDGDPRVNWRRVAWLFAAYAVLVSIRLLPTTVKRLVTRNRT
jgi:hypothetical protein